MKIIPELFIGCRLYALSNAFFGLASIGTLTVLAIERYIKLCSSASVKQAFHRNERLIVGSIWFYALAMSVPPMLGWGDYVKDAYWASCTFDFYSKNLNSKSYLVFLLSFGFILPCSCIVTCYISIFLRIRDSRNAVKKLVDAVETQLISKEAVGRRFARSHTVCSIYENNHAENSLKPSAHLEHSRSPIIISPVITRLAKEEVKFAKLSLVVIIGFLICWTPYAFLAILYQFDWLSFYTPITSAVTLLMAKSSVALNPIIYVFREKQFRSDLVKLMSGSSRQSYTC